MRFMSWFLRRAGCEGLWWMEQAWKHISFRGDKWDISTCRIVAADLRLFGTGWRRAMSYRE